MKRILLTLAALGTALTMQAKVVLPGIFGDNMVLQQQSEAQFWGKAAPGKKVTIRPSWSTQGITANVGKDGRWRAVRLTVQRRIGVAALARMIASAEPSTGWLGNPCTGISMFDCPEQSHTSPISTSRSVSRSPSLNSIV